MYTHTHIYKYTYEKDKFMSKLKRSFKNERIRTDQKYQSAP